ncbi:hypothetical protein BD413DRAFT_74468 [Trametes elegans]|nr:hypothetical protein BD413DRAFT_74468 [Trametes elegans]
MRYRISRRATRRYDQMRMHSFGNPSNPARVHTGCFQHACYDHVPLKRFMRNDDATANRAVSTKSLQKPGRHDRKRCLMGQRHGLVLPPEDPFSVCCGKTVLREHAHNGGDTLMSGLGGRKQRSRQTTLYRPGFKHGSRVPYNVVCSTLHA